MNLAVDFCRCLFGEAITDGANFRSMHSYPALNAQEVANLGGPISNMDIKKAMFAMGSFKTPRIYG